MYRVSEPLQSDQVVHAILMHSAANKVQFRYKDASLGSSSDQLSFTKKRVVDQTFVLLKPSRRASLSGTRDEFQQLGTIFCLE